MPYLSGPACTLGDCPTSTFPAITESCVCTPSPGGINELYFIPCTETFSEVNVTDPYWWANLVDTNVLGRSGLGLGSIAKKSSTSERFSSCRTEQPTAIIWALTFVIKCFDKTSGPGQPAQSLTKYCSTSANMLLLLVCATAEEVILPIGVFAASDFDWTVPDNFEENQSATIEISWYEFAFPCTVDVPGLQAVVPKLA